MPLNAMMTLYTKLKNGICKKATKSQVVTTFKMSLNQDWTAVHKDQFHVSNLGCYQQCLTSVIIIMMGVLI